jgi:iron complex outermembrane receptor protein
LNLSFRILVSLLFLYSHQLQANSKDLETKEIQVESDPSQVQEVSSTFAKEIYNEKDILRSGSLNLFDFLSQYTSLNILPNYGDKTKPLIDMRGYGIEAGYQNLVINVDNQRINNIDMNSQMI